MYKNGLSLVKTILTINRILCRVINVESYCLNVSVCSAFLFGAHHTGEGLSADVWCARYPSGALCTCMVHQCTIGTSLCARESLCVLVHTHKHCASLVAIVCRHQPPCILQCPSSWALVCSWYHELSRTGGHMTGSTGDIVVVKSAKSLAILILCAIDVIAICSSLWRVLWILH